MCGCVTVWGNWVILFRKWSSVKEGSRLAGVVWFGATWTLHCFLWNCVSSLWTGVIEWFQHMVLTVFEVIVSEFLTYRVFRWVVFFNYFFSFPVVLLFLIGFLFRFFFIIFEVCLYVSFYIRFYIRIFHWLFYYLLF